MCMVGIAFEKNRKSKKKNKQAVLEVTRPPSAPAPLYSAPRSRATTTWHASLICRINEIKARIARMKVDRKIVHLGRYLPTLPTTRPRPLNIWTAEVEEFCTVASHALRKVLHGK